MKKQKKYDEYQKYIKWLTYNLFKAEIDGLNKKYVVCFNNNGVYNSHNHDQVILALPYNYFYDTTAEINTIIKENFKDYKFLDIKISKIEDKERYSSAFFIGVFLVKTEYYDKNKELYDSIFEEKSEKLSKLLEKIQKNHEVDKKFNIAINNLYEGNTSMSFDAVYNSFVDTITNNKKKLVFKLNLLRKIGNAKRALTGKQQVKLDYNTELAKINDFEKSENVVEDTRELKRKLEKQKRTINVIRKTIVNNNNLSIVVLMIENEKRKLEYANLLSKFNILVLSLNPTCENYKINNKYIDVVSNDLILTALEGFRYLYIIDDNQADAIKTEVDSNAVIMDSEFGEKGITEEKFLNDILNDVYRISALANLDHINSIKVLTSTFLDFEGENYYCGGAERYLIDLHEICTELGYKLRIYQKASCDFFRYYNDIEVVGVSDNNEHFDYEYERVVNIKDNYDKIANKTTMLNIYSAFNECMGKALTPSIGISHGVGWDSKYNKFEDADSFVNNNKWVIDAAKSCDKLVSVDNNTPNWFQTLDFKLGNNTAVVPNYVDITQFHPAENKSTDRIILTYPRRIYEARGMYLLLDIIDEILEKYPNLDVHFVGKGFEKDLVKVKAKMKVWKDRIKLYSMPPEKMHEVYKNTDISVIPTLYSEGTSLSCLEAMATGNAVIATRIGGLTDLIINDFNGKLIEPNSESLLKAICEYMDNPESMEVCRKNAMEVSKVFNKVTWKDKWKEIINKVKFESKPKDMIQYKLVKIYLSADYDEEEVNKLIVKYLLDNCAVYVITEDNKRKCEGFGRLQYISIKQELYRSADIVIAQKNMEQYINEKEKVDEYID